MIPKERIPFIEDINERRKAFLEYTMNSYNSGNRAVASDGKTCVYHPTETSPGCAIGQWLTDEEKSGLAGNVYGAMKMGRIPKWMVEMGINFLSRVQQMHDFPPAWDETVLSRVGEKWKEAIINDYITCTTH